MEISAMITPNMTRIVSVTAPCKLKDAMDNERLALVESIVHEIEAEGLTSVEVPRLSDAVAWIADQRATIGREETAFCSKRKI